MPESKFLMLQQISTGKQEIRAIVNWFEELNAIKRE
jgi:hypothetical protein